MRAQVEQYHLVRPADLAQALNMLAEEPQRWRPLAGGTDLMVLLAAGKLPAGDFLDLSRLSELQGCEVSDQEVRLGALTTYAEVLRQPVLRREFPNLVEAAAVTGAVAIQNRGTLGGNLANASPAADSPPALLSYAAQVELVSSRGRRRIAYQEFHRDYKVTALEPGELISAIVLPRSSEPAFHYYRKVGTRKAQAISKVCLAGCVRAGEVRLGMGAVAPIPASCARLASALSQRGALAWDESCQTLLRESIAPIDDLRSNCAYRSRVAGNLMRDFWERYQQWRS